MRSLAIARVTRILEGGYCLSLLSSITTCQCNERQALTLNEYHGRVIQRLANERKSEIWFWLYRFTGYQYLTDGFSIVEDVLPWEGLDGLGHHRLRASKDAV